MADLGPRKNRRRVTQILRMGGCRMGYRQLTRRGMGERETDDQPDCLKGVPGLCYGMAFLMSGYSRPTLAACQW